MQASINAMVTRPHKFAEEIVRYAWVQGEEMHFSMVGIE